MIDLKEFRKQEKIKQKEICDILGIAQPYASAIERGERPLGQEKFDILYKQYGDVILKYNLPDVIIKKESQSFDASVYDIPENIIKAPLIGQYANGGYLRGYADPVYLDEQPIFFSTRKHSKGNYVAFEVRGDSMNDGSVKAICEGDILLGYELQKIHWTSKLHIPKVFIIVHRTEGITVKEVVEHDIEKGRIKCHCWNREPEYEDFELYLMDVHQLFYIKEVSRNVKY